MGGMPSRGGPPDSSSASGIRAFAKFVFQPRVEKWTPVRDAAVGTAAGVGADVETGASPGGSTAAPEQAARPTRTASPQLIRIGVRRTNSVVATIVPPDLPRAAR